MADRTKIEWCDSTWNPIVGCSKVSSGCTNCFAERMANRFHATYDDVPSKGRGWTGDLLVVNHRLDQPLHWRKPRRIFVCSMSDLYHPKVPREIQCRIMGMVLDCPQHDFLVLTKRPGQAREFHKWVTAPANMWIGTTAENQEQADKRIPILLDIEAKVHFVSIEPMLGPVDLSRWLPPFEDCDHYDGGCTRPENVFANTGNPKKRPGIQSCGPDKCVFGRRGLDWVICGGESGPGARAMHPAWPRAVRDQCVAASIPFLFKQWGEWQGTKCGSTRGEGFVNIITTITTPVPASGKIKYFTNNGDDSLYEISEPQAQAFQIYCEGQQSIWVMEKVGKHAAGRKLDGRLWDQYPEVKHV